MQGAITRRGDRKLDARVRLLARGAIDGTRALTISLLRVLPKHLVEDVLLGVGGLLLLVLFREQELRCDGGFGAASGG